MSGYESDGSIESNKHKKSFISSPVRKNGSWIDGSRSLVHDEELYNEISFEKKSELAEELEIKTFKVKRKNSLRAVVSRNIKKPTSIFKSSSYGNINASQSDIIMNNISYNNITKTQKLSHISGITCTLDTETGNSSFNVSNPILLFQPPTLSRMYTVSGAQRQGFFSNYFAIKKIAHPDGILRLTAIKGTLIDLVEWCTYFPGSSIIKYLLLSFRLCYSADDLYNAFMELWAKYLEAKKINDNFKERCYVFIVQWILLWGCIDFTKDLRDILIQFVTQSFNDYENGIASKHILTLLNSPQIFQSLPGDPLEIDSIDTSFRVNRRKFSRVMTLPLAMLSPRHNTFNVLDFDTETLCNHLTWIESELFQSIRITEFLHNNWLKDNKKVLAPNLTNLSDHFNKVSTWAATIVLSTSTGKRKVRVFHKFLRIIRKLLSMRNYSTACQIVTGLNNFAITRLKTLQTNIPSKYYIRLEKYQTLLGPHKNYKKYRKLSLEPPCIPLLPVHLRDIAVIEDNEHNFINNNENILNFDKFHSLSMTIYTLYNMKFTMNGYNIDSELSMRDIILTSIKAGLDSEQLYKASLTIQPIVPNLQLRRSSSCDTLSEFEEECDNKNIRLKKRKNPLRKLSNSYTNSTPVYEPDKQILAEIPEMPKF